MLARKPRESPYVCEETIDVVVVTLQFCPCSVEKLCIPVFVFITELVAEDVIDNVMCYLKHASKVAFFKKNFVYFS